MMGGDIMPRTDYASRDLLIASKHEYVTTEASLLVGVLVMFYMSVILILFGVNIPCFRWRFQRASPPIQNPMRGRKARSIVLEDSIIQEEDEPLKDLQVVAATDRNVITEIAAQEDPLDERSLEGITVV